MGYAPMALDQLLGAFGVQAGYSPQREPVHTGSDLQGYVRETPAEYAVGRLF